MPKLTLSEWMPIVLAALASSFVCSATPADDIDGGGSSSSGTNSTSSDGAEDSSSSLAESLDGGGTDTASGESGSALCEVDADCVDASRPACVGGQCQGCGIADDPNDTCAGLDAARPVCGADGACVACTAEETGACTGSTPICDPETRSCVGCIAHEQCPETACDIDTGECFPSTCVRTVDIDGGPSTDFVDLGVAVASVPVGESCVIRLRRSVHGDAYTDELEINDGRRIAIVGDLDFTGLKPTLEGSVYIRSGAVGYLSQLHFMYGELVVEDAKSWIEQTDLGLLRILHADAHVVLSNSWVLGSLRLLEGHVEGVFTTISAGGYAAISCDPPATARFRNSLLVNFGTDTEVDCAGIELEYCALNNQYPGTGNRELGPTQIEWFEGAGDIRRLSTNAPLLLGVTARWTEGDPIVDIDGEPRPSADGTMHYAGADVP